MMRLPESFSNIRGRETLARSQVLQRSWPVCAGSVRRGHWAGLLLRRGAYIAQYWFGHPEPEIVISQSPRALPLYAFYSVVRIGLAYLLSLVFRRRLWIRCGVQQADRSADDCGAGHSAVDSGA